MQKHGYFDNYLSTCNPSRVRAYGINDYTTFGSPMTGRTYEMDTLSGYRFGFNGMELDNQVKLKGNSYTTEFRQYDSRLGRWLSLDPKTRDFPEESPYEAFYNNPIFFIDPMGDAPPFTREQLINEAFKYSLVNKLFIKLDPVKSGWTMDVYDKGASKIIYKDIKGIDVKIILIQNTQSIEQGVQDLVWEVTNALNAGRLYENQQKARTGTIDEKEYIMGNLRVEAEAMFNSIKIADAMGKDLTKMFDAKTLEQYNAVKSGVKKVSDFVEGVSQTLYDSGTSDAGDGKGKRLAREIYAEQYQMYKKAGPIEEDKENKPEEIKGDDNKSQPSDSTKTKKTGG